MHRITPPSFHFTARYSRAEELRGYRAELSDLGYRVTSRWIDHYGGKYPSSFTVDQINTDPDYCAQIAMTDMLDIDAADMVLAFTEADGGGKGGRHWELGYAVAHRKRILLVGPREHVFHTLPFIQQHDTWAEFITFARSINATSSSTQGSAASFTTADGQGFQGESAGHRGR